MRFRFPLTAALLATLALSACETSSPSPADSPHPSDPDTDAAANGTLAVSGKTIPIRLIGNYNDTILALAANSAVAGSPDSGWTVTIAARPGKISLDLPLPGKSPSQNGAAHFIDRASLSLCAYHLTGGSLHIDSWSERPGDATGKVAEMSGGAALMLTPDSPSGLCSTLSATLSFAKAPAVNLF